jgi:DNA-binding Xre family transcriptional regulator
MNSERLKEYRKEYYEKVTKRKRSGETPGKVDRRVGHGNKKCNNPFYTRVDELSIQHVYTNTSLAQAMNVNYASLNNWLKLKTDIPITEFFKLCELLEVDPSDLYKYFKEAKDAKINSIYVEEENL